jgi:hypothetical protein
MRAQYTPKRQELENQDIAADERRSRDPIARIQKAIKEIQKHLEYLAFVRPCAFAGAPDTQNRFLSQPHNS